MDKRLWKMLHSIGVDRVMLLILLLRAPFDLLNAVIKSNMLEQFLRIAEQGEREKIGSTFWTFLLCSVLLFAYNMTVWMTISVTGTVAMHRGFRRKMFGTILNKNYGEIRARSNGSWITGLGSDIDRTCDYLTAPLNFMHLFIALICFIGSSVILCRSNVTLFVISLAVMLPFFFFSSGVILKPVSTCKKRAQEKLAEYANWVEPVVNSHTAIRVFGGEDLVLQKVEETSLAIMRENMKGHRRVAASALCNIFSGNLGYLLLLFIGNSMMGAGIRDFAMLSRITQYRGEMMGNVMMMNNCIGNMRTNQAGVERVYEVLEEKG